MRLATSTWVLALQLIPRIFEVLLQRWKFQIIMWANYLCLCVARARIWRKGKKDSITNMIYMHFIYTRKYKSLLQSQFIITKNNDTNNNSIQKKSRYALFTSLIDLSVTQCWWVEQLHTWRRSRAISFSPRVLVGWGQGREASRRCWTAGNTQADPPGPPSRPFSCVPRRRTRWRSLLA